MGADCISDIFQYGRGVWIGCLGGLRGKTSERLGLVDPRFKKNIILQRSALNPVSTPHGFYIYFFAGDTYVILLGEQSTLKRFGLKTLLVVITLIAFAFWAIDDGYRKIYSQELSTEYKLTIRAESDANLLHLRITYHHPPGIGLFAVDNFSITKPDEKLRFSSVTDSKTGIKCIFDDNNAGFVFMFSPANDDLWHTGRDSGWTGSSRADWETRFTNIRKRHPEIPYTELPPKLENAG